MSTTQSQPQAAAGFTTRRCIGFGYNLTGLAIESRCPECGAFSEQQRGRYVERSRLGWLRLLVPAMVMPFLFIATIVGLGFIDGFLRMVFYTSPFDVFQFFSVTFGFICIVVCIPVAIAPAYWRYGLAVRSAPEVMRDKNRNRFICKWIVTYTLLAGAWCVVAEFAYSYAIEILVLIGAVKTLYK